MIPWALVLKVRVDARDRRYKDNPGRWPGGQSLSLTVVLSPV